MERSIFDKSRLARLGVTVFSTAPPALECNQCGQRWLPSFGRDADGQAKGWARGYWKCPNGCNANGAAAQPPEPTLAEQLKDSAVLARYIELSRPA